MQKRTKQIIALVLALVFVAAIAITIWSCNRFDFAAMKYEGYDYAAISAYFIQTEKDVATETNRNTGTSKIMKAQDYLLKVNTQYSLIELEYLLDRSNEWAQTEYRRVYEEYVDLSGRYIKILSVALNNSYLSSIFSEEDKAYILAQSRSMNDEYIRLMVDISGLEDNYNDLEKTISVTFDGVEYNWESLEDVPTTDPNRKNIYNTYMDVYSDAAGDVLLSLRDKYNELAVVYGEENYADCAYKYVYERDYTPAAVSVMRDAVKTNFNGMYFDIENAVTSSSYVSTSAIKSKVVNNFSSVIKKHFKSISPSMLSAYEYMDRSNLYVVGDGKNAYTGAFTSYLPEFDAPYIYQYVDGSVGDISTFVHEFGHFYALYACGGDQAPMDTCEIQSQANEWLFMPYYKDVLLSSRDTRAFEMSSLASNVLSSIQMGCIMDELQQTLYTDDTITDGSEVTALFEGLLDEYGAYYKGSDYDFKYFWSMIPHTFNSPFYYISYAMSLIPSLEIYQTSLSDSPKAIRIYNRIINEGAYKTFGGLLDDVGLSSPLLPSTISNLSTFIKSRCGL